MEIKSNWKPSNGYERSLPRDLTKGDPDNIGIAVILKAKEEHG